MINALFQLIKWKIKLSTNKLKLVTDKKMIKGSEHYISLFHVERIMKSGSVSLQLS